MAPRSSDLGLSAPSAMELTATALIRTEGSATARLLKLQPLHLPRVGESVYCPLGTTRQQTCALGEMWEGGLSVPVVMQGSDGETTSATLR